MKQYKYQLGPYCLATDEYFSELSDTTGVSPSLLQSLQLDVDNISVNLSEWTQVCDWLYTCNDSYYFCFEGLGNFTISHGKKIVCDPIDNSTANWHAFFLGPVLNVLCLAHGYLALHACSVLVGGKAVLFGADSGGGKSTMSAAMRSAGYKVVSDDLAIIKLSEHAPPVLFPAYPTARLWPDTLQHFGIDKEDLALVHSEHEKRLISIAQDFYHHPVEVGAVCKMEKDESSYMPDLELLQGFPSVLALAGMTHRNFLFKALQHENLDFKQCANFASDVHVYKLNRPWGFQYLPDTIALIKATFDAKKVVV